MFVMTNVGLSLHFEGPRKTDMTDKGAMEAQMKMTKTECAIERWAQHFQYVKEADPRPVDQL